MAALQNSNTFIQNPENAHFGNKQIILITDGQETEGDYKSYIESQKQLGKTDFKVFIIGIAQDDESERKSKEIATITNGDYVNLKESAYVSKTVDDKLQPFLTSFAADTIKGISTKLDPPKPILSEVIGTTNKVGLNPEVRATSNSQKEGQVNQSNTLVNHDQALTKDIAKALDIIADQMSSMNQCLSNMNEENSGKDVVKFEHESPEFNETVRIASEKLVFEDLKKIYSNTIWLNEKEEAGNPFDFEVLIDSETKLYVECKGSMSRDKIFLLTKNEWHYLLQNRNYSLYFVSDVFRNPKIIRIHNFWEALGSGKIVPYSSSTNIYLKNDRIAFTINI